MNVSSNLIRFPVAGATPDRSVAPQPREAKIVAFQSAVVDESATAAARSRAESQEHGQLFAAQRIVTRVADQLDQIAAL